MSRDVDAVVGGLLDAGIERVTVKDFHRSGYNLLPEMEVIVPEEEIRRSVTQPPPVVADTPATATQPAAPVSPKPTAQKRAGSQSSSQSRRAMACW